MRKIQVVPRLESLLPVCEFFEEILTEHGVPAKVVAQLNIAADEIFSNIVRYSGATLAVVGCEADKSRAVLQFSDNGKPYDPTKQPEPDTSLSAEERSIGGLGIFMVKKIMDQVDYGYADGWNTLTIEKNW